MVYELDSSFKLVHVFVGYYTNIEAHYAWIVKVNPTGTDPGLVFLPGMIVPVETVTPPQAMGPDFFFAALGLNFTQSSSLLGTKLGAGFLGLNTVLGLGPLGPDITGLSFFLPLLIA